MRDGVGGGTGGGERRRGLAGEPREVLLHGLEFADRPLEGDALVGVSDAERQDRFQCAGSLDAAHAAPISSSAIDRNGGAGALRSVFVRSNVTAFAASPARFWPSLTRQSPVLTNAIVAPLPASAPRRRCVVNPWRREFRAARPLRLPSELNDAIARADRRDGHRCRRGSNDPARDSSHPASSVSASGTGKA